ncbi:1-acyl-sn-glycerol-3-phosphate acyltransferase [Streptomyces sp. ISL-1]|uniref:lysophospholipid acyltransferase family protein n=1 Tax=Streptomyces sp. ISL-1 TaxID=2817657 RepID=UPI001BEAB0D7|nr:lysophospholipid acyltransferase family protein [Streptomyces sp. ISL-1]MBT2388458.1 1-acyl-sn-glycerol-3-phosphate acyltransferase [Streptomyces sp. ISL-1]
MSVWLPSAPCTPGGCATHHGAAADAFTAAARLLAGTLTVLAGLLLAPAAVLLGALFGTRVRDAMTRCWARAVVRAFGVRIRIIGRPQGTRGALVVANHISWLDIPLIAAALPGRMLAKSEVRRWPVLGPLAARGGTLFVERDRLRTLPATVREMASALDSGARVIAFPEGSTWCGRAQGRFRHAVFQAALDADAAVQPVRISYLPTGAAAFVGEDSLVASLWRVVAAGGLTAEVRLLPPIPARSHPDRRSLARAAQRAVERDSAYLPSLSVHHFVNSSSAAASSVRTPS